MLPFRWSALALDELDAIILYIAERNPDPAEAMLKWLESSVLPLSAHPYLFRPGRIPGTR